MLLHLQNNVTLDNYEEVLTSLSGAVRGAAINEQVQSTNNLAMVAATFERSAALINEMTIVSNTVSSITLHMFAQCVTLPPFHSPPLATHQTVENLVSVLEGLQQWDENVLQANTSKLAINKYFLISPSSGRKYHCYIFLFLAVLCVPLTQWSVYLLSSWKTDRIFLL